ncbi:alpha/beta hydrolase [Nonomuraea bangladeshensis]|uniref:Alpha/beta hydrolase n=1 Tax=Nonomuraea bangladeshensis TaxID=404385 RepID=A0ABV3HLI0_9ACTN
MRAWLAADEQPAIVVGHSYGGVVAGAAAAGPAQVRQLVYIASFLPQVGESLASFGDGTPAPYLDFGSDGTFGVRAEVATRTFLQDCDREAVEQAHARLVRQSAAVIAAVITGPVQAAAWQHVPSTYVVCAQDNGTPAAVQRVQAGRATHVVEVATGHHPFLSRPSVVARLLLDLT